MDDTRTLIWINFALAIGILFAGGMKHQKQEVAQDSPPVINQPIFQQEPETPKVPSTPNISNPTPAYLDYGQIIEQLNTWKSEAPDLTEVGTYGKTARNKDVYYIRVRNNFDDEPKPKVLITACLHGNEPWSTGCVMAYVGNILASYGKDVDITELVNSRDIYFVPVVSPDSYPHSRHVDGVDPNRDFPGPRRPNHRSTPSVAAIQDFFNKIKPNAVISGHTYGRIFLSPYGDNNQLPPHNAEFTRIIGEMARLCRYRFIRASQMYNSPIYGSEVDWYYRNGAFSVVMEFGTHQRKPTQSEINSEFERTYKGVLHFIKEAPVVISRMYRVAA